MRNLFRRRRPEREPGPLQRVLLASEGRLFGDEVIDLAAELVRDEAGHVRVLTIARLWGSGWGLPHPGLRPNKREMAEYQDNIARAISRLNDLGVSADGHIITTRKPCRAILGEARDHQCQIIVMGADPLRSWLVRDFMWSQEPYRVQRRAFIPTRLVCPGSPP